VNWTADIIYMGVGTGMAGKALAGPIFQ